MTFNEWCISQKDDVKKQFKRILGYNLNLDNLLTFCEKLNWLKVYDSTFLKTYCADKLLVREYVKDKLGIDLSIPVLGVYDKFEDIDFSKLPKNYVIKCNHGSGMNIIVKDGKINKTDAKQKLDKWMNMEHLMGYEFFYKPIKKKIYIEKFMENIGRSALIDYKFYCFNGKPTFCQVITDRLTKEHISHYDMNWNFIGKLEYSNFPSDSTIQKPNNFETMSIYASKLSKEFKFVRVDFYEVNDKLYFSELTFIPAAGYISYKNKNTDLELGELLAL